MFACMCVSCICARAKCSVKLGYNVPGSPAWPTHFLLNSLLKDAQTHIQSQVLHKSIKTISVCSGGQTEREESFDVNPVDRDCRITFCPSDVILIVTCQIIL